MSVETLTKLVKAIDAVRDPAVEHVAEVFDSTFNHKIFKKEGLAYALIWGANYFKPELKATYKGGVKAGRNNAV